MKFLYKIYSGYDGFRPTRIADRIAQGGGLLELGWKRYIDAVNVGDEIWVYFRGPPSHNFESGVYLHGLVRKVDPGSGKVSLKPRGYDLDRPITDAATSAQIAEVVALHGPQVFLFPEEWEAVPNCTVGGDASSCAARRCESCAYWKSLPLIEWSAVAYPKELRYGNGLMTGVTNVVSGFWVIPARSYVIQTGGTFVQGVRRTDALFRRFKIGGRNLTYPLALAMYRALAKQDALDFDVIVPFPLSPDKAAKREFDRTTALATELGRLLGVKVMPLLTLTAPVSRKGLKAERYTNNYFAQKCLAALVADARTANYQRLLLVDDVCTEGMTAYCAVRKLREANPNCAVTLATAGQMVVKDAVLEESAVAV